MVKIMEMLRLLLLLISLATLSAASDVQSFFADEGSPEPELLTEINSSQHFIHLCIYSFTDRALGRALVAAGRRGVDVRLLLDESQTEERNSEANYLSQNLGSDHVQIRRGRTGPGSIMHHKFAIFDGERVATGSYNWTTSAKNYNFENLIVISGASGHETAEAYEREFKRVWATSNQ